MNVKRLKMNSIMLLNIKKINEARKILLKNMSEICVHFERLSLDDKFIMLMKSEDVETISHMNKFISETVKIRGKL